MNEHSLFCCVGNLTAIAGIFSGATLADRLGDAVAAYPAFAAYGKPVAIIAVTIAVT